jgi:hypothetical protein
MTDPAKRERAALDVLALLPEWWRVGPTSYDPGTHRWYVTARGPNHGRLRPPETVRGIRRGRDRRDGDLRTRLDERRRDERLAEIDRPGRAAFLEGAEAQSQAAVGRPLTADELERVTKRYLG